MKGRELQLSKSWMLALGDREDLAARLRFKLGIDLYSGRTYCRFGFRTEESAPPINLTDGLPLQKKIPLDPDSHVNLEVRGKGVLCTSYHVIVPGKLICAYLYRPCVRCLTMRRTGQVSRGCADSKP